jgi:hypothetical protein
MGIPEMNKKMGQAQGIQVHLRSGAIGRRFLHQEIDAVKIVAFKQKIRKFFNT